MFGSFVTIASCDSAAQLTGASWPAIAFAQRLQCHSAPKPQGAKKKICSRSVRNRNATVPEHDKAPATRYRNAHYGQDRRGPVSLVAGQYYTILHVPGSVCDWLVLAQAGQARCTLHDARCSFCSLLVARCLWGGSNSQPTSHSLSQQGSRDSRDSRHKTLRGRDAATCASSHGRSWFS